MSVALVDLEDLICPGCGEQVRGEPPVTGELAEQEFSHGDGTPLCGMADPIERAAE